eukprot:bmy_17712T0
MTYLFLNIQQQLAFQLELEMQEKERQRIEELQRAQEQFEKELRMSMENIAKGEDISHGEDGADSGKTLAEISDRYGAPNLSRVEELDEPMLSDVSILRKVFCEKQIFFFFLTLGEPSVSQAKVALNIDQDL